LPEGDPGTRSARIEMSVHYGPSLAAGNESEADMKARVASLVIASALCAASAFSCASTPPPTERLASAKAGVRAREKRVRDSAGSGAKLQADRNNP
jgi:hypothetical protein